MGISEGIPQESHEGPEEISVEFKKKIHRKTFEENLVAIREENSEVSGVVEASGWMCCRTRGEILRIYP